MDDLSPKARSIYDLIKDTMPSTSVSLESVPSWDQVDVYPPLAELRRALMTDAEWAAMSEWDKDLWEIKHLPEKERLNSIEGVVMWLPEAQRAQRRMELLEEILRFGEPALMLDSATAPASAAPDISPVLQVPVEFDDVHEAVDSLTAPTPCTCSTVFLGGDMRVTSTPSSPAAVPTSPETKPTKPTPTSRLIDSRIPTRALAATKLIPSTTAHGVVPEHCCFPLELATDACVHMATPTCVPTEVMLDSTSASAPAATATSEADVCSAMLSSCLTLGPEDNTDAMLSTLVISNFTHDLLVESECSDAVIDTLPQVLEEIPVTTLAVPNDDTLQDDQGLLSTSVIQFAVNDFAITLDLIIVEECLSLVEKIQHLVMLEKLQTGLSLELKLLVLVVMRKEPALWPSFQYTSRDTILLLPWDPGALVYGRCTKFQVELEQKWMVSLVEQQLWPSCVILLLFPITVITASRNFCGIVMLEWVTEEALILMYFGKLHEKQNFHILGFSELLWQYSSCKEFQFESFPWYIAWFLVGFPCTCSEFGGSGDLTNRSLMFGSWEGLDSTHFYLFSLRCITLHLTRDVLNLPQAINPWQSLPPAKPCTDCDVGILLMAHGWMEVLPCGVLTVQWYSMVQVSAYCLRIYPGDELWCACASLELSVGKLMLNIEETWECVIFLQPKPPWSYLTPTIYTGVAESLHIIGISLDFDQSAVAVSHGSRLYGCLDFERKLMDQQFIFLLGIYCSCNHYVTEDATSFRSQLFKWQIPWYICPCRAIWLLCSNGHIIRYGFKVNQWMIAWSLHVQYSSAGNKFAQLSCANTLHVSLLTDWIQSYPTVTAGCYYITSSKMISASAFHLQAHVAIWNFCSMKFGCRKLLWNPGIWALLCFSEFFAQAAAEGRIMVEALTYCYSHHTAAFLDQALFSHDYYINFLQVHSDHIYDSFCHHCDPGNFKESHVPWDTGGSTFDRLGVKPNFMEGGLSATSLCTKPRLDGGPPTTGLWPTRIHHGTTNNQEGGHRRIGLERTDGTAASAEAWFGSRVWRVWLCSSSSSRSPSSSPLML